MTTPPTPPTPTPYTPGDTERDSKPPAALPIDATKTEYDHLISYFKWLVTISMSAIGLVVAVATYMFYKDMREIKADARQQVEAVRQAALVEVEKVRGVAKDQAQARIEELFKSSDITRMVEQAAKRTVGTELNRQVRNEVR